MDLPTALKYIAEMEERGTCNGEKVGRLTKSLPGIDDRYHAGQTVIYEPSSFNLPGRVEVLYFHSRERIVQEGEQNSLIKVAYISVPYWWVEEYRKEK